MSWRTEQSLRLRANSCKEKRKREGEEESDRRNIERQRQDSSTHRLWCGERTGGEFRSCVPAKLPGGWLRSGTVAHQVERKGVQVSEKPHKRR